VTYVLLLEGVNAFTSHARSLCCWCYWSFTGTNWWNPSWRFFNFWESTFSL